MTDIDHQLAHHSARHHRSKKIIKHTYIVIGIAVTILIGLVAAYFITAHAIDSKKNGTKQSDISGLVTTEASTKKSQTIQSQLGFKMTYDSNTMSATGQVTDGSSSGTKVTGQEYVGTELDVTRPYDLIHVDFPKSDTATFVSNQRLTILTNIRKDYFTSRMNTPENTKLSEMDIWINDISADNTAHGETASKPVDMTINGILYKKIIFTETNIAYGIKTMRTATMYLTVQNHRPYYAKMTNQTSDNMSQTSELEAVIKSITYTLPVQDKLSLTGPSVRLISDLILPSGSSNVPKPLDPATVIQVVAKNQIAVVRIATMYCNNLTLSAGTARLIMNDACTGGIGSGSIVSSDGYIATNGHVVVFTPKDTIQGYINLAPTQEIQKKRIKTLVDYLVAAQKITQMQANALIADVSSGNAAATAALQQIPSLIGENELTATKRESTYAVQLGNHPIAMKLAGQRAGFGYDDTIVPAKFIAANYDPVAADTSLTTGDFTTSDVAVLKVEGSYPTVQLGNIDTVSSGDELTAIGFPAFVDGGLSTTKLRTVPSVTQGIVLSIGQDGSGFGSRKILHTDVPIGHGNSGGPAFTTDGKQVGLNTYSLITCPDKKCFGDGTVRDIADYKSLLHDKNISLHTTSDISTGWNNAIETYLKGNYKQALAEFTIVKSKYPANYLAASFIELSRSHLGTTSDASLDYDTVSTLAIAISIVVVAISMSIGFVIFMVIRTKRLHTTEQPQLLTQSYGVSSQPLQPAPGVALPPVTLPPSTPPDSWPPTPPATL